MGVLITTLLFQLFLIQKSAAGEASRVCGARQEYLTHIEQINAEFWKEGVEKSRDLLDQILHRIAAFQARNAKRLMDLNDQLLQGGQVPSWEEMQLQQPVTIQISMDNGETCTAIRVAESILMEPKKQIDFTCEEAEQVYGIGYHGLYDQCKEEPILGHIQVAWDICLTAHYPWVDKSSSICIVRNPGREYVACFCKLHHGFPVARGFCITKLECLMDKTGTDLLTAGQDQMSVACYQQLAYFLEANQKDNDWFVHAQSVDKLRPRAPYHKESICYQQNFSGRFDIGQLDVEYMEAEIVVWRPQQQQKKEETPEDLEDQVEEAVVETKDGSDEESMQSVIRQASPEAEALSAEEFWLLSQPEVIWQAGYQGLLNFIITLLGLLHAVAWWVTAHPNSRFPIYWKCAASFIARSIVFVKLFDVAYFRLVWWLPWAGGSAQFCIYLTCIGLPVGAVLILDTATICHEKSVVSHMLRLAVLDLGGSLVVLLAISLTTWYISLVVFGLFYLFLLITGLTACEEFWIIWSSGNQEKEKEEVAALAMPSSFSFLSRAPPRSQQARPMERKAKAVARRDDALAHAGSSRPASRISHGTVRATAAAAKSAALASPAPVPMIQCHRHRHDLEMSASSSMTYLTLVCNAKCLLKYHQVCWRSFLDSLGHKTDRDMLGAGCLTPNCWGRVLELVWFNQQGEPTGKKLTHKEVKEKKETVAATSGGSGGGKMKKKKEKLLARGRSASVHSNSSLEENRSQSLNRPPPRRPCPIPLNAINFSRGRLTTADIDEVSPTVTPPPLAPPVPEIAGGSGARRKSAPPRQSELPPGLSLGEPSGPRLLNLPAEQLQELLASNSGRANELNSVTSSEDDLFNAQLVETLRRSLMDQGPLQGLRESRMLSHIRSQGASPLIWEESVTRVSPTWQTGGGLGSSWDCSDGSSTSAGSSSSSLLPAAAAPCDQTISYYSPGLEDNRAASATIAGAAVPPTEILPAQNEVSETKTASHGPETDRRREGAWLARGNSKKVPVRSPPGFPTIHPVALILSKKLVHRHPLQIDVCVRALMEESPTTQLTIPQFQALVEQRLALVDLESADPIYMSDDDDNDVEEEEEECLICTEILKEDLLSLEPCGHVFHGACVTAWLTKQATCPKCRAAVHC